MSIVTRPEFLGHAADVERIVLPTLEDAGGTNFLIGVSRFEVPVFNPGLGMDHPDLRAVRWTPVAELANAENRRNSTSL